MTKAANMFEVTEALRSGGPQGTRHLATGIGLSDLSVDASDCGQYLMINCGGATLAVIGAMGSDVGMVEFADGSRYPPEVSSSALTLMW